ncbi:Uncharacterized protein HZ326_20378 [Fusarium oxysporum f. sp. albedinis]|nr:Uncharacterized protein HZ326_20378 [Fusarium oxysporum f. sp. albedinis]
MVMKDSVVVLFERPLPYQGTAHIFTLSLLAFWLRFMLNIKPSSHVNLTCVLCVAQTSEISGTDYRNRQRYLLNILRIRYSSAHPRYPGPCSRGLHQLKW